MADVPSLFPLRFRSKFVVNERGCWTWTAYKNRDGYGKFSVYGRPISAHRYAYELANGPVPGGACLDHLCRNRACCNPEHLQPVTQTVNVRRGKNAKLSESEALEVCSRYAGGSITLKALSEEYGITKGQVWKIVRGRRWKPEEAS